MTTSGRFALPGTFRRLLKPRKPGIGFPARALISLRLSVRKLGHLPFIAEDLGIITPDVVALRDEFELPGIRVFQFGFDGNPVIRISPTIASRTPSPTPERTTTTPLGPGLSLCRRHVRQAARTYAGKTGAETGEVSWDFISSVWSSKSGVAIAPLQDLLNLGVEGRMNVPGVAVGNWRWRCTEEMLKPFNFRPAARTDNFY